MVVISVVSIHRSSRQLLKKPVVLRHATPPQITFYKCLCETCLHVGNMFDNFAFIYAVAYEITFEITTVLMIFLNFTHDFIIMLFICPNFSMGVN